MKIALIGKGPSRGAWKFGDGVSVYAINETRENVGWPMTIPEHLGELIKQAPAGECFFAGVLIHKDMRDRPVNGHAAPRVLRGFLHYGQVTRIYLQGFDLSEPQYTCQLREFAKIARIPGARDRIIVTTPGPLGMYFPCRAPDPEDLADVG